MEGCEPRFEDSGVLDEIPMGSGVWPKYIEIDMTLEGSRLVALDRDGIGGVAIIY